MGLDGWTEGLIKNCLNGWAQRTAICGTKPSWSPATGEYPRGHYSRIFIIFIGIPEETFFFLNSHVLFLTSRKKKKKRSYKDKLLCWEKGKLLKDKLQHQKNKYQRLQRTNRRLEVLFFQITIAGLSEMLLAFNSEEQQEWVNTLVSVCFSLRKIKTNSGLAQVNLWASRGCKHCCGSSVWLCRTKLSRSY